MNAHGIYCSACGKANPVEAAYCHSCGQTLQTMAAGIPNPGEQPTAVSDHPTPEQLLHGRYAVVSLLGRGGMGAVYKAEDTQFGNRPVAIKEMNQSGLTRQETLLAAEQFKQEALLLANLNHPNLPSIYDHFNEDERWYLVMDFVDGVTLEKYVSDAETDIKYYYANESDFKGVNVIQSFDSLTYQPQTGPVDQPQFMACAEYKFAKVSSPDVTADTARHTFTFQYSSGNWSVIDMGNWNSC